MLWRLKKYPLIGLTWLEYWTRWTTLQVKKNNINSIHVIACTYNGAILLERQRLDLEFPKETDHRNLLKRSTMIVVSKMTAIDGNLWKNK